DDERPAVREADRLVLSAVAVLELEGRGASGESEELVAEADPEGRERSRGRSPKLGDGRAELGRVPRSVPNDQARDPPALPLRWDGFVVRHSEHAHAPVEQRPKNARFHPAVENGDEGPGERPEQGRAL